MKRVLATLVREGGQLEDVRTECDNGWDAIDAVIEALARKHQMRPQDVLIEFQLIVMSTVGVIQS